MKICNSNLMPCGMQMVLSERALDSSLQRVAAFPKGGGDWWSLLRKGVTSQASVVLNEVAWWVPLFAGSLCLSPRHMWHGKSTWTSLKAQVLTSDLHSFRTVAAKQYDNKLSSLKQHIFIIAEFLWMRRAWLTWVFCFTRLQSRCWLGLCFQAHVVTGRIQVHVGW